MVSWKAVLGAALAGAYLYPIAQLPVVPTYSGKVREKVVASLRASKEEMVLKHDVEALRAQFAEHGFYIIKGAVPRDVVQLVSLHRPRHFLHRALYPIERSLLRLVDWYFDMDYSLVSIDSTWTDDDLLMDFWSESSVGTFVHAALPKEEKTSKVRLLTDFYVGFPEGMKPPVIGQWHTDNQSFDLVTGDSAGISVWIPLRDIDSQNLGGSLHIIDGAKARGIHGRAAEGCGTDSSDPLASGEKSSADKCEKFFDTLDQMSSVQDWTMGDILVFDKVLYHKSQPMKPAAGLMERYSVIGRFITDKSKFKDPGSHIGTHKKNSCKHGLADGNQMVTACFPQVFPDTLEEERKARDEKTLGHDSIYAMARHEFRSLFV